MCKKERVFVRRVQQNESAVRYSGSHVCAHPNLATATIVRLINYYYYLYSNPRLNMFIQI